MTGKVRVEVSPEFFRPAEVDLLIGNPRRAAQRLGWRPRTPFKALVRKVVEADLNGVMEEKINCEDAKFAKIMGNGEK